MFVVDGKERKLLRVDEDMEVVRVWDRVFLAEYEDWLQDGFKVTAPPEEEDEEEGLMGDSVVVLFPSKETVGAFQGYLRTRGYELINE